MEDRRHTYDVPTDWRFPALDPALPDGASVDIEEHGWTDAYQDGPTYPLARAGVGLRRRAIDGGASWELRGPEHPRAEGSWTERRQTRRASPPPDLVDVVSGALAGARLRQVAEVHLTRLTHTVHDRRGAVVAVVDDDQVRGVATGSEARTTAWRTIGMTSGDHEIRTRLDRLLRDRGADPDGTPTLPRVLGLGAGPGDNALGAYLRKEARAAVLGDVLLRRDLTPRHVHRTRVALRRLRSTLRTFPGLLDLSPATMADARDDLAWAAHHLGRIRDVDVVARGVREELGELPVELAMGPLVEELDEALGQRRTSAARDWSEAVLDPRHARLMALLGAWAATPPVRRHGDKLLRRRGRKRLRKAERAAARRLARAADDPARLHRARKAFKRARYAAESLAPVLPEAARSAKRAKRRQQRLGRHQDLVLQVAFLREQAARFGPREGHNAFAWGVLWARADALARVLRSTVGSA